MPARGGRTAPRRSLFEGLAAQLGFDFGDPAPTPTPRAKPRSSRVPNDVPAAEPLTAVVGVASWQHPQATHQVRLPEALIGYQLKRGKRRTIGMSVGLEGVVVNAPRWVGLGEIELVLQDKGSWLLAKLSEMQTRRHALADQRIDWRDGVTLPLLGAQMQVVLSPTHASAQAGGQLEDALGQPVQWEASGAWSCAGSVSVAEGPAQALSLRLLLALPLTAQSTQIRDAVQAWLMRFAMQVFTQRLDRYAPELDVNYTRIALSSAKSRWGSADAKGQIRLNWRLIHGPLSALDYVVVHELSHLREMNHGPRFWGTVASVIPTYADERERLNQVQWPVW